MEGQLARNELFLRRPTALKWETVDCVRCLTYSERVEVFGPLSILSISAFVRSGLTVRPSMGNQRLEVFDIKMISVATLRDPFSCNP
jgi:hypothetical protein